MLATTMQKTQDVPIVEHLVDQRYLFFCSPGKNGSHFSVKAIFCDGCGYSLHGSKSTGLINTSEWSFDPMRYGILGWIETLLGVFGIAMGFALLSEYENPGVSLSSLRIGQAVMTGFTMGVYAFLMVQRFFYKELFAFLYAVLCLGGAICALIVVVHHKTRPGSFFLVFHFAICMSMGVKMFALCCIDMGQMSKFNLEDHPWLDKKWKLWIIAVFMCLISLTAWGLQLTIILFGYEEF